MRTDIREIVPGVFGMDCGGVNVYFLEEDSGGLTLVDAGLPGSARRILSGAAALGKRPADIKTILVTHADVDHVGGLSRLARESGGKAMAGAKTIAHIRDGSIPAHIGYPALLAVRALNGFRGRPPAALEPLEDGSVLPIRGGLRAIATPGHTEDHFAYFLEREGILFCGDIYRPSLGPAPFTRNQWSPAENEISHAKLMRLGAVLICPGHGDSART